MASRLPCHQHREHSAIKPQSGTADVLGWESNWTSEAITCRLDEEGRDHISQGEERCCLVVQSFESIHYLIVGLIGHMFPKRISFHRLVIIWSLSGRSSMSCV